MMVQDHCLYLLLVLAHCTIRCLGNQCEQDKLPTVLMARLFYGHDSDKPNLTNMNCSAVIINSTWLLSPASCLFDYTNPYRYQVEVMDAISKNKIVVKKIERNPSFNNELGAGFDLALINVDFQMPIEKNCTLLLPSTTEPNFNEQSCQLVKVANTAHFNADSIHSKAVSVHLHTDNKCKYINQVDQRLVECAGGSVETVCPGETGSVILCTSIDGLQGAYYLRDMSSWGDILCKSSQDYLFTKIGYYSGWINQVINAKH